MPTALQPTLLTTAEAAEYLRLRPQTLRLYRCRGGGPPYCRSGARPLYRLSDLLAWLDGRTWTSTSAEAVAAAHPTTK